MPAELNPDDNEDDLPCSAAVAKDSDFQRRQQQPTISRILVASDCAAERASRIHTANHRPAESSSGHGCHRPTERAARRRAACDTTGAAAVSSSRHSLGRIGKYTEGYHDDDDIRGERRACDVLKWTTSPERLRKLPRHANHTWIPTGKEKGLVKR